MTVIFEYKTRNVKETLAMCKTKSVKITLQIQSSLENKNPVALIQILFFCAFNLGYQLLKGTVLCIYSKICCIYTNYVKLNLKSCCISFSCRQLSQ